MAGRLAAVRAAGDHDANEETRRAEREGRALQRIGMIWKRGWRTAGSLYSVVVQVFAHLKEYICMTSWVRRVLASSSKSAGLSGDPGLIMLIFGSLGPRLCSCVPLAGAHEML